MNLEWVTRQEDCQHAQDTGLNKARYSKKQKDWTKKMGYANRLTSLEVAYKIRKLKKEYGFTNVKLAMLFDISFGVVNTILYKGGSYE